MKKILIVSLLICFTSLCAMESQASSAYNSQVRVAVAKYKAKNYVGCMQDLEYIVKKDPSNSVAHYYLGVAYMRIGNKDKALAQFDKVISLNSASSLTCYSIQAKNCLNSTTGGSCQYVNLSPSQVRELKANPTGYIQSLKDKEAAAKAAADAAYASASKNQVAKDPEIEKLINGTYKSKIHPDANKVIIDTMLKQEQNDINNSAEKIKSEAPTDKEIAEAVKVLAKAGINPLQVANSGVVYPNINQNNEYAMMGMMLGNNQNNNNNNNNMMNMLPYLMQSQGANSKVNAEMVQAMMMSQMLPDMGLSSESKY